jgi:hypothetical protein
MEQPPIYLFDIKIQEPVTSLTDIIVGVACLYFFQLLRSKTPENRMFFYFRMFFLLTGIGTILGGLLGHAFLYTIENDWLKTPGWLISMVGVTMIERGCIEHSKNLLKPNLLRFFKVLNIVELLVFMALSFYYLDFLYVQVHSTYGLVVVVFAFELYVYLKTKQREIIYILLAVLSMVICAVVYSAKVAIHPFFNHADLAHVFMLISAILCYKGISRMQKISYGQSRQTA